MSEDQRPKQDSHSRLRSPMSEDQRPKQDSHNRLRSSMSEDQWPKQDSHSRLRSPMSEWVAMVVGRWSSDIGDLSRLWLSCLGRWSSYSKIFIYYLAFQSFRLGWTWWRLFQKHIVLIELDICYITKELNLKIIIKSITVSVIWFKRIISHTYVQLNKKM
jgi:hypothetical protein